MSSHGKHNDDRFPAHTDLVGGTWRRVRTVTCSRCGYPSTLTEKAGARLPESVVAKKFLTRGWSLNGSNVCPRCQQGKRPMSPAARRAAFCALNRLPQPTHKREPKPMTADPPPVATVEERRRIREALDTHYDEDAGRYRSSFSDKAVAAKLNMPAKWVTDLRELNGYGPDQNESAAVRAGELDALQADVAKLQTELLSRFDEIERRLRKYAREHAA